jgi:pimeloyl-ACP methyl ester carboxylesterase
MADLAGGADVVELDSGISVVAPGVVGSATVAHHPIEPETEQARAHLKAVENAGLRDRFSILISHSTSASGDVEVTVPRPKAGTCNVMQVIDESGVITWHFARPSIVAPPPSDAIETETLTVGPPPAARSTFMITSARFGAHPSSPLTGSPGDAFGPQSLWFGHSIFRKIIKVLEFPIDAVVGGGAALGFSLWERHKHPATVRWFPPQSGRLSGAVLDDANWRLLTQGRALLFLHGIFSDSASCFGGLSRQNVWPALEATYGSRIFAYDMATASVDPVTNARDFLDQIPDGLVVDVDIVCHSRGGLVARILAGQHPEIHIENVQVRKIVFAGTPNGGTAIAEPENWDALFDRFTNMVNLVPPGPWTETLTITDTVLQLIKHVAEGAERLLPGLNSMEPTSSLYEALDSYVGPTPKYYAIDTNFVPPPILNHLFNAKADAGNAGDAVIDQVFDRRPNDVAVPTIGVADPGDAGVAPPPAPESPPAITIAGFPIPNERHLSFGASTVWHCSYFNQRRTAERIVTWLTEPA